MECKKCEYFHYYIWVNTSGQHTLRSCEVHGTPQENDECEYYMEAEHTWQISLKEGGIIGSKKWCNETTIYETE